MRLTKEVRAAIYAACVPARPDASIIRVGGVNDKRCIAVVWRTVTDPLMYDEVKVPARERWHAQLVEEVDTHGIVWWSGQEHIGRMRRVVVEQVDAEARS